LSDISSGHLTSIEDMMAVAPTIIAMVANQDNTVTWIRAFLAKGLEPSSFAVPFRD
jgi:hypothetical protein